MSDDDRPPDQRPSGFPIVPITLAAVGSALATLLLTRLGLVGTLIGAALTPVIIITVQELGQRPVSRVRAVSRVARDGIVRLPETRLRPWERVRWRRVLVLAAAAFALTVAAFTAVEAVLGRSLTGDRERTFGTRTRAPAAPPTTTTVPAVTVTEQEETPEPPATTEDRPATTDAGTDTDKAPPTGTTTPPATTALTPTGTTPDGAPATTGTTTTATTPTGTTTPAP